jgi:hypothetical protein
MKDLPRLTDSIQIKKVLDYVTTLYNEKVKEEKAKD